MWTNISTNNRTREPQGDHSWRYTNGQLDIIITCKHEYFERGEWVLICSMLGDKALRMTWIERFAPHQVAQQAAIDHVRNRCEALLRCLPAEDQQRIDDSIQHSEQARGRFF